jgi:hypothetical protein
MNKKTLFLVSILAVVIAGCSSNPYEDMAKDQANAREVIQEAHNKAVAMQQEKAEDYIDLVPEWIMTPPKADADGFYASGIGKSKDLSVAMAKSMVQAEFNLAKSYSQTLSANEQYFKKEDYEQYVQVIDTFIDKVDLTGYSIEKRVVKPVDGVMQSFVLLKMPFERFNYEMSNEISKSNDAEAKAAFKALKERIKETVVKTEDTATDVVTETVTADSNVALAN